MDNLLFTSGCLKYICYGLLITFAFYIICFSVFVYLNGREIREYYLILFGKLGLRDIILIFTSSLVFSTCFMIINFDKIIVNPDKQETVKTDSRNFKFDLNLNVNLNHRYDRNDKIESNTNAKSSYSEESTKYYPLINQGVKK